MVGGGGAGLGGGGADFSGKMAKVSRRYIYLKNV